MHVVRRGAAVLVLASILLVGAAGPAVASGPAPGPTDRLADGQFVGAAGDAAVADSAATATINVTQEFGLTPETPGRVVVTVRYVVPDPVVSLRTQIPAEARVTDSDGFDRGANRQYHWNGSTPTPSVTYLLPVNESVDDGGPKGAPGERVAVDAGDWALFQRPPATTHYEHTDPVGFDLTTTTDGAGATGEWLVYLGDHRRYERTAHGQRFRLVVPTNATLAAPPERVLDAMAGASDALRVGDRDRDVFVVAAPTEGVDWGVRGAHVGDADLWVRDVEPLASADNAWLHEYVHSRQQFVMGAGMDWFREASASYYAALVTYEQGRINFSQFRARLAAGERPVYDDAVLGNRSTWTAYPAYDRGALVAGRIDRQIRLASDDATLATVVRALNDRPRSTSHADFREAVAAHADATVANATDRYVTTATNVSTWNESAHAAAFGPATGRVGYALPSANRTDAYRVTGPYRQAPVDGASPVTLASGERLAVDAVVTNEGDVPAPYNATLYVNGTAVDAATGTVAATETRTVRLDHAFERPGRYAVSVGGDDRTVVVRDPTAVRVDAVSVDRHAPAVGETVTVTAVLRNDAAVPATGVVRFSRNGLAVRDQRVTVAPDGARTVAADVRVWDAGRTVLAVDVTESTGENLTSGDGHAAVTVDVAPSTDPGNASTTGRSTAATTTASDDPGPATEADDARPHRARGTVSDGVVPVSGALALLVVFGLYVRQVP